MKLNIMKVRLINLEKRMRLSYPQHSCLSSRPLVSLTQSCTYVLSGLEMNLVGVTIVLVAYSNSYFWKKIDLQDQFFKYNLLSIGACS